MKDIFEMQVPVGPVVPARKYFEVVSDVATVQNFIEAFVYGQKTCLQSRSRSEGTEGGLSVSDQRLPRSRNRLFSIRSRIVVPKDLKDRRLQLGPRSVGRRLRRHETLRSSRQQGRTSPGGETLV